MSKKKQEVKRLTLRQRLRQDAEKKLDAMISSMRGRAEQCVEEYDSKINPGLLMQLASQPTQGKTLRSKLITELANEREADLERLYNNQMGLPIEESDDD